MRLLWFAPAGFAGSPPGWLFGSRQPFGGLLSHHGASRTFCESRLCFGLHLLENCLTDQPRERIDQTPVEAKLPQCCPTEALDPRLCRKHRTLRRLHSEPEIPRCLCVTGAGKPSKVICRKVGAAPAIGTPKSSCNSNDDLLVWNFRQNNETCALEPLRQIAGDVTSGRSLSGPDGYQQANYPQVVEVGAQKALINGGARGTYADFVGRTDIIERQEFVDPSAVWRGRCHLRILFPGITLPQPERGCSIAFTGSFPPRRACFWFSRSRALPCHGDLHI